MPTINPVTKLVISLAVPVALTAIQSGYSVIKKNHDKRKAGIITLKKSQYREGTVTINA